MNEKGESLNLKNGKLDGEIEIYDFNNISEFINNNYNSLSKLDKDELDEYFNQNGGDQYISQGILSFTNKGMELKDDGVITDHVDGNKYTFNYLPDGLPKITPLYDTILRPRSNGTKLWDIDEFLNQSLQSKDIQSNKEEYYYAKNIVDIFVKENKKEFRKINYNFDSLDISVDSANKFQIKNFESKVEPSIKRREEILTVFKEKLKNQNISEENINNLIDKFTKNLNVDLIFEYGGQSLIYTFPFIRSNEEFYNNYIIDKIVYDKTETKEKFTITYRKPDSIPDFFQDITKGKNFYLLNKLFDKIKSDSNSTKEQNMLKNMLGLQENKIFTKSADIYIYKQLFTKGDINEKERLYKKFVEMIKFIKDFNPDLSNIENNSFDLNILKEDNFNQDKLHYFYRKYRKIIENNYDSEVAYTRQIQRVKDADIGTCLVILLLVITGQISKITTVKKTLDIQESIAKNGSINLTESVPYFDLSTQLEPLTVKKIEGDDNYIIINDIKVFVGENKAGSIIEVENEENIKIKIDEKEEIEVSDNTRTTLPYESKIEIVGKGITFINKNPNINDIDSMCAYLNNPDGDITIKSEAVAETPAVAETKDAAEIPTVVQDGAGDILNSTGERKYKINYNKFLNKKYINNFIN